MSSQPPVTCLILLYAGCLQGVFNDVCNINYTWDSKVYSDNS